MASDKVIDSAVLQYPAVLSPFEIPSVRYPPPEFIVPCSAASVFALSASSMVVAPPRGDNSLSDNYLK